MSRKFEKLEEELELPSLESIDSLESQSQEIDQALQQAKQIQRDYESLDHYDQHDVEMDNLAGMAIKAHQDLQDLGMNVEVRHAGEIFSSSSQMLKIAVDAKNNKVEKKLKLLKLQLEKMRIDKMPGNEKEPGFEGTAIQIDRNEILQQLRQMNVSDK